MDFISREQLIAATSGWVLEKQTPLAEILRRQQALGADEAELLEALVNKHLARHDNDPQKSLAAVSSIESVSDDLKRLADPDIEASLAHVSQDRAAHGDDPLATENLSIGESTSAGLRFRVLRPHAKGGLGEVFVAEDGELHREVALKQIKQQYADDPTSRSRFMLEAEITGGLEHPGIVPVYGLGTYSDGRPFYAMRFIKGDSLKDAIERFHAGGRARFAQSAKQRGTVPLATDAYSSIDFRKLLGRFVDVCNAIEYAHSRGVLHRDLKPGNIMLGKYGETLVVDWGLAKALGATELTEGASEAPVRPASGGNSAGTQMGSAIGTPRFMSPEQAEGRLDVVGARSDVYSLGATLYCLLTGEPPLANEDDTEEVLRRVTRGEIPSPRTLRPQIPKPLEAICMEAMAAKPGERYASPRALADDIEHWLADEPVTAFRESVLRTVSRFARRHRTLAASFIAVLLTIALGSSVSAVLINQQRKAAIELQGRVQDELYDALMQNARAVRLAREPAFRDEAFESLRRAAAIATKRRDDKRIEDEVLQCLDDPAGLGTLSEPLTRIPIAPRMASVFLGQKEFAVHGDVISATDGTKLGTLPNGLGGMHVFDFSPTGSRLAVGYEEGFQVFELPSLAPRLSVRGWVINDIALDPSGLFVATVSWRTGVIEIWSIASGRLIRTIEPSYVATGVRFSKDGRYIIALGANSAPIAAWSFLQSPEKQELAGHTGMITRLAFSPDGSLLASVAKDGTLRLWDALTGAKLAVCHQGGLMQAIAFSADGETIATGDWGGNLFLWETSTGRQLDVANTAPDLHQIWKIEFSSDGSKLIAAGGDALCVLSIDRATRKFRGTRSYPVKLMVRDMAVIPNSTKALCADDGGAAFLVDFGGEAPRSTPLPFRITPQANGKRICFRGSVGHCVDPSGHLFIKLWNGKELVEPEPNSTQVSIPAEAIDVSSDGKWLATCGVHGVDLSIIEISTGAPLLRWPRQAAPFISCVAWSPDGIRVAIGSGDGLVHVWDLERVRAQLASFGISVQTTAIANTGGAGPARGASGKPAVRQPSLAQRLADFRSRTPTDDPNEMISRVNGALPPKVSSDKEIGSPFVEFDDPNGFWGSPGVPDDALRQFKTVAEASEGDLKCFAFTPDGDWVLLFDGEHFRTSNVDLPACKKLAELQRHPGVEFKCVAFSPEGGWTILWNQNGSWTKGRSPGEAFKKISELSRSGSTLNSIAYGPRGAWVLVFDRTRVSYGDVPNDLAKILDNAVKKGLIVRCVAFVRNDWICLTSGGWWTSDPKLPAAMLIDKHIKQGQSPRWIAIEPTPGN